jgi:hypothetical protein
MKKRQGKLRDATEALIEELEDVITIKERDLSQLRYEKSLLEKKLLEDK